ncbi:MAG TPA: DUF1800 domain-containing protein [Steroidobacteraceae bacterium]|jgi:uncharacterized protein (DUF1800 family)|nr:DUF1800 domain-containing protein [Steroidobacteraceae bacterium]
MQESPTAAIAANRFGLGARPGELSAIGGDPRAWLREQLRGAPPALAATELQPSADTLAQALSLRREIQAERKSARAGAEAGVAAEAQLQKVGQLLRPVYVSEAGERIAFAVGTERPFLERLTQFWSNHFAVSVDKALLAGLAGGFEREAIRPNVLGNFRDLLLAVETHPAMILYLDNEQSVGPHSQAAARAERRGAPRRVGINENLAREILELHTLGVGAGYTQGDVTTFAEVISGWSIGGEGAGRFAAGAPGHFVFRPELHEPGAKIVLNTRYPEGGFEQGVAVLHDLARQSATAQHIATKLARHFIADEPPPTAVGRIAAAFTAGEGHLPSVYAALIETREAWAQPLTKYKTPNDYVTSALRGVALPPDARRGALAPFELLGQRTWQPGSPAGWPDKSADWDGASALMKRLEWAEAVAARLGSRRDAQDLAPQLLGADLSVPTRAAVAHAASAAQALTLLLAAPEFMRR